MSTWAILLMRPKFNDAQRWAVVWGLVMVARALVQRAYAEEFPSGSSARWAAAFMMALAAGMWWAGVRRYRRLPMSNESRALAIRLWHATIVLLLVASLVIVTTGAWSTASWLGSVSMLSFVAMLVVEAGTLAERDLEKQVWRFRTVTVVMGVWLLGSLIVRLTAVGGLPH